ncbi:hypothetical protein HPB52_002121 [Rhipicephalus sanguineus]|uniref:Uncharacterized protein n=1 Tax=Rhipicephalus sanguineus TaxID=34632 RepID=A0A9D4T6Q2_RHISA|nr:hypothetical protein HPB52_002121 [Rhipicephalus sanguineus]
MAHRTEYCPDAGLLSPCTCDDEGINCMRVRNPWELRQSLMHSNASTEEQKELWIQKTPIKWLMGDVLGNFKFDKVHIEFNAHLSFFLLGILMKFKELLSVLSLYGNALPFFDFQRLQRFPNLVSFNLGGNQLTSIPQDAFRNYRLEKLGLNQNPITYIGERAFLRLSSLRELYLGHTRLTILGPYSLAMSSHPSLRASNL